MEWGLGLVDVMGGPQSREIRCEFSALWIRLVARCSQESEFLLLDCERLTPEAVRRSVNDKLAGIKRKSGNTFETRTGEAIGSVREWLNKMISSEKLPVQRTDGSKLRVALSLLTDGKPEHGENWDHSQGIPRRLNASAGNESFRLELAKFISGLDRTGSC